jgi:hypothetical protein
VDEIEREQGTEIVIEQDRAIKRVDHGMLLDVNMVSESTGEVSVHL